MACLCQKCLEKFGYEIVKSWFRCLFFGVYINVWDCVKYDMILSEIDHIVALASTHSWILCECSRSVHQSALPVCVCVCVSLYAALTDREQRKEAKNPNTADCEKIRKRRRVIERDSVHTSLDIVFFWQMLLNVPYIDQFLAQTFFSGLMPNHRNNNVITQPCGLASVYADVC